MDEGVGVGVSGMGMDMGDEWLLQQIEGMGKGIDMDTARYGCRSLRCKLSRT